MTELPEEILNDLRQMCGGEPSPRLQRIVAGYLQCKHAMFGGPPNADVLALACSICRDVNHESKPVLNPFANVERGTPLEVLRAGSKEIYGVGFLMAVGQGVNAALVQVAMYDSEEEAAWFPFDQVRLRGKSVKVKPSAPQEPLVVIPDPPPTEDSQTVRAERSEPEIEPDEQEISSAQDGSEESLSLPVEPDNEWLMVDDGKHVWMEDGREGHFRGIDATTGHLKVSIKGVHQGSKFSLYLPDQVRLAEEIPVEHDPVDVGEAELPDREVRNPYSLQAAGA